jgi:hypothetical protein
VILSTWITFSIAAVILCVSPGPGALSSMSSRMRYGWSRGTWNVLDMQTVPPKPIALTICAPMATPAPMPTPAPATPPGLLAASRMAPAISYCV